MRTRRASTSTGERHGERQEKGQDRGSGGEFEACGGRAHGKPTVSTTLRRTARPTAICEREGPQRSKKVAWEMSVEEPEWSAN